MAAELLMVCPNCFSKEYRNGQCPVCGYQVRYSRRSQMALPEGIVLEERYILGRVLGEGGFGITYKAQDIKSGTVCAIKEYVPSGLVFRNEDHLTMGIGSEENKEAYHNGLERFLEEAQILNKLGRISSVVHITDSFRENETAYFSMEYLDGANLKQIVRASKNRIQASEITNVILQVAMAMDIIHNKAHILHRDLSPDNICITKDQKVKIIDFGSAKQYANGLAQNFSVVVKLRYAPPEQFSSNMKQGTYTDVYSLASTYYYALTGTTLPSATDRLGGASYVPLKQMNISVSEKISDTVDKALKLNYQERVQTMQEFVEGLTDHTQKKVLVSPPALPETAPSKQPFVEVLSGNEQGKRWILPVNREIRIGRSKIEANLLLTGHPEISKVHCILFFEGTKGLFYIRDMSRNGTFVEGKRLEKGKTYLLKAGNRVSMATAACTIRIGVKNESG